jgi:hypothetical protein
MANSPAAALFPASGQHLDFDVSPATVPITPFGRRRMNQGDLDSQGFPGRMKFTAQDAPECSATNKEAA